VPVVDLEHQQVQSRHTFIYRVLKPQRATLSLVRGADGDWEISELELRENNPVADLTRRFVQSWLDDFAFSA